MYDNGFYWLSNKQNKDLVTIGLKYNNYWSLIGDTNLNEESFILENFNILSLVQLLIQEKND